MEENSPTVYRSDYQPYPFTLDAVALHFELDENRTVVTSTLTFTAKDKAPADLVLNAEDISLDALYLNGQPLSASAYALNQDQLVIAQLSGSFELRVCTTLDPAANSLFMGLYKSGSGFFTQCEAEGFRRITYFPDRPDVMSIYTVTLSADKEKYPYLLSNGNLLSSTDLPDGRHQAVWHDPFHKPSYLFALVAGDFDIREKTVKTHNGRDVLLQVYSDKGSRDQTAWALASLERSLVWDEKRFGLELDLDRFMIVAVRDFNMGAMENKGLNIFNSGYVLADPDTATDANFSAIEAVIGHEYFHNWTGNRVTCRDWFQLSLKEGLTVFRDQEFTADMMAAGLDDQAAVSARAVKRIDDVSVLRAGQFPEDAGPMAHPIRPDSYESIGNFYTATVYEKGAEVIRMQHTLLGAAGFRDGMDEYFRRHDGQAVTCDDFVNAMEYVYTKSHPQRDLSVFRRWYAQAGTPRVQVVMSHDAVQQTVTLTLSQQTPLVGVEKIRKDFVKKPFHIPFAVGLLSADGQPLALSEVNDSPDHAAAGAAGEHTRLLELTEQSQSWTFTNIAAKPVPSLLRDFSAPVIVHYEWTAAELAVLAQSDPNPFARWEAGQALATREILGLADALQHDGQATLSEIFVQVWKNNLQDASLDAGYRARLLTLPSEKFLAEQMDPIEPVWLAKARHIVREKLGKAAASEWTATLQGNDTPGPYSPDPISAGRRSLKNLALTYLMAAGDEAACRQALAQYQAAQNMTDCMGALGAIVNHHHGDKRQEAIVDFYEKWQHNPLVIDKWFALQATAIDTRTDTIRGLMAHPAFSLRNPNRARSLIFQFCMNNAQGFHNQDGSGYALWTEAVLALDAINPEVASRLARVMDNWARYTPALQSQMKSSLEQIRNHEGLSSNVSEIVSKALRI
ncbi:MAG TPA: aminopeptidase N [Advenella sp.]|nr:aminopeptidase N [Advenella sp.]